MTTKAAPVCLGCVHFQGRSEKTGDFVCSSFPDGIPDDIQGGDDPHIVTRKGEDIFKPKDVVALAHFVRVWVVPYLNPDLTASWGALSRRLHDARRERESR